jgi:3-methyl-2-oxobutanoate hydroxymethyltransferase
MSRRTLTHLHKLKAKGEKITCLTAYDASFAQLIDQAGIEMLLVGDSLGMVIQGHETTLPVTLDDMIYHCKQVYRGSQQSLLIVDMPFMSYATPQKAFESATRLISEGQAQVIKLEGGNWLIETVEMLTERGIPVCAHLGLTPQSIHQLGGYRVQGRTEMAAECLRDDAVALQSAGASLLILECVPSQLAAEITALLDIPVIGIGAGSECDGQVLVLYDMLGITPGKRPSFSKDFLQETGSIPAAIEAFGHAVKQGTFPGPEQSFK